MMLDNDKQIDAFGILTAQGSAPPAPIISYRKATGLSDSLKSTVTALYLADVTYPPSISGYTDMLPKYINTLAAAAAEASRFIAAIQGYTTPSDLLQMKIGWECYAKGNRLTPVPPFALVEGLCDTATSESMIDALNHIELTALSDAMTLINEKMLAAAVPPGGEGEATPPPVPPSFTPAEIEALKVATETLSPLFSVLDATSTVTSDYTDRVNNSTAVATKSLANAVAITLTVGLTADPVMSQAIASIMPPGVIDALKEE
ncbi:hypothetical protein VC562_20585 [Citrobacter freundii]|nr:hypothetical protein [Citrobacter freundii]MEB0408715.1 hypothetical protein [Citrobacter freundii]